MKGVENEREEVPDNKEAESRRFARELIFRDLNNKDTESRRFVGTEI